MWFSATPDTSTRVINIWLYPRSPSSPAVSRAMIHFHRLRVEVRMPSARSERVVAPCGSVLEHLPVRPRPFRAFRCGFDQLKAVSGDSGDEWLVEPG